ncbi:MAG TPA: Gfo/Idh/MocA family oxidoreductase [Chloroflexota bacterium]|nr:Gfo/Idh/MocA family oxidoreductase [Chloroflexota bacterium]
MTTQTRVHRVACISAARMASWFDDIQRERAQKDGGRSLEWVPGAIASVCEASDRAQLVAVCDLKPELLEQFGQRWPGPALYTDWREMVERERPDVVAVVTAYGTVHGDLAAAVAETGLVKGIYCEKPIAASMAQADRIAAACARHHVAYSCAHVFRWNARYRQALAWIQDGAIGDVRSVAVSAMGTLLHSGTHQIDAILGLAGDADPEWAMGWVDVPPDLPQDQWPRMDPIGGGYAQLTSGVHLLMDARAPGPRTFTVNGTLGKIHLVNDLRQLQLWRRGADPTIADLEPGPLLSPPQEKSYALTQMEELLDVLEHGGTPSCDHTRATRALELALGLHLSHRAGGARITFPLQDRAFAVDTK